MTDQIKTTEEIREEQSRPRAIGDMKHGLGGARPQMSILPRAGLVHGGRAIEYGADKYARGNYHGPPPAKLGQDADVKRLLGYIDAAMRHLTHVSDAANRALGTGGDVGASCAIVDDEASAGFPASNLPHLAHALASLLIGVSCAVDDGLLPADPGQPWRPALAAMTGTTTGEPAIAQKDDPAAERERVRQLRAESRAARREILQVIAGDANASAAAAAKAQLDAMDVAELDAEIAQGFEVEGRDA